MNMLSIPHLEEMTMHVTYTVNLYYFLVHILDKTNGKTSYKWILVPIFRENATVRARQVRLTYFAKTNVSLDCLQ